MKRDTGYIEEFVGSTARESAIKIMQVLNFPHNIYEKYFENNEVCMSLPAGGTTNVIPERVRNKISEIEANNNCEVVVYHVIKSYLHFERFPWLFYTLLVAEREIFDLYDKTVFAYVINDAIPQFSEYGEIGISCCSDFVMRLS